MTNIPEIPDSLETSWQRIEREAREQRRAELDARALTTLEFGVYIAWVEHGYKGVTNGVSPLHRVGLRQHDAPYTTCGEQIPEPVSWFALSPRLIRTMARCQYCDAQIAHVARGHVARGHAA